MRLRRCELDKVAVRTLDALHLASLLFVRVPTIELASYDDRLTAGARALEIRIAAI